MGMEKPCPGGGVFHTADKGQHTLEYLPMDELPTRCLSTADDQEMFEISRIAEKKAMISNFKMAHFHRLAHLQSKERGSHV